MFAVRDVVHDQAVGTGELPKLDSGNVFHIEDDAHLARQDLGHFDLDRKTVIVDFVFGSLAEDGVLQVDHQPVGIGQPLLGIRKPPGEVKHQSVLVGLLGNPQVFDRGHLGRALSGRGRDQVGRPGLCRCDTKRIRSLKGRLGR